MIKFPCICKHNFAVEDELAGGLIQCPRCGRLNDVPTLDELKNFTEDGIYRVDLAPLPKEPDRINELKRAYSKDKVDDDGQEFDLRQTREDIDLIGLPDESPAEGGGEPARPAAPKYDPVTGELIRPMDFVTDPSVPANPADIPMARATLAYARADTKKDLSSWRPFTRLLQPINLVVMFFVLLAHVVIGLIVVPIAFGYLIAIPMQLVIFFGLIAHYGIVIEEIGCEQQDELPRLFRHFAFYDDIWLPFVRVMIALIFAYAPAILMLSLGPPHARLIAGLSLAALGTLFFPVLVLTTITGADLVNLRPDRLIGVIAIVGLQYLIIVGLFVAAIMVYLLGIGSTALNLLSVMPVKMNVGILSNFFFAYGVLFLGIYLMHAFSWYLGLVYRAHHDSFPWAHQRHIRTTPQEKAMSYEARMAAAKHRREMKQIDRETARRLGY